MALCEREDMKKLFLGRSALAIKEVCQPLLDDHSILVAVAYSFISSGNGLAKIINDREQSLVSKIPNKVKRIAELVSNRGLKSLSLSITKDRMAGQIYNFGHSCSGVVIAVGAKVHAFRVGDFVACAGTNFANHSDVVCVPQHLVVQVPKELDIRKASLTGIGAIALHAVERAQVQLGQRIAIFGLETVGQMALKICQTIGSDVLGIDHDLKSLKRAQLNGIKAVYDLSRDNVVQIIDVLTDYVGIDCAIITPDFILQNYLLDIVRSVRRGGRIVIASNHAMDFPTELACQKEIDVCFATSHGPSLYCPDIGIHSHEQKSMSTFVGLLSASRLDLENLVSKNYVLSDLPDAIGLIQQRELLGVVLDYQSEEMLKNSAATLSEAKVNNLFIPAWHATDVLKLGVLGGNRRANASMVPTLSQLSGAVINTIVEPDVSRSAQLAQAYKGAKVLNGNLATFQNDDSNVIFINKDLEVDVDQVIALLGQGKAVFVERAFLDTQEKLERVEKYLQTNTSALLCVGYSLRFALFVQKIKKQLDKRSAPFLLHYRVNLGAISQEQRFVGAWRFGGVMAYAAPILDLFCFLAGSKPLSVSSDSVRTPGNSAFSADNFSTTISFADGSVCSLLFTTLGDPEMGKERLELFFDAKSIVMTDYKNLIGYGVAPYFDEKDREPDLGLEHMLSEFLSSARRNSNILSIDELIGSAKLALTVDQMVY